MSEKPILFSAPMVRAILAGEKTQTRRAVKPQPAEHHWRHIEGYELSCKVVHGLETFARFRHHLPNQKHLTEDIETVKCPYGKPGVKLWVRETWSHTGQGVWRVRDAYAAMGMGIGHPVYRADGEIGGGGWFPSIHMPRAFSRITLKVTDVRVQRLQDISDEDAEAEGCVNGLHDFDCYSEGRWECNCGKTGYRETFARLWGSINGAGSWEANPWVYAISFDASAPGQIEKPHSGADELPLVKVSA